MLVIVGTYRKRDYIDELIQSVETKLVGITELVFVDDSGDEDHQEWLSGYGEVVANEQHCGYNMAMKAVCKRAGAEEFMFLEEDFTFNQKVNLPELSEILEARPHLAQIALLRQPWFPVEHDNGGLLEALVARGYDVEMVDGIWEQTATFTGNPAVWRAGVALTGWPDGKWSEDAKRDELLAQGDRFGYMPGVRVHHRGVRSGFGY
jgi:glycosyltransferase involved in cell wall biosynthesis